MVQVRGFTLTQYTCFARSCSDWTLALPDHAQTASLRGALIHSSTLGEAFLWGAHPEMKLLGEEQHLWYV